MKNGTTNTTASTALSAGTHLVVMRYTFNTGTATDDEVALWVDPSSSTWSLAEGSVPAATLTTTTGNDFNSLSNVTIFQANAAGAAGFELFLDEVRVATSWASVTPADCNTATVTTPTGTNILTGQNATFSVTTGGTAATNQWQVSTDNGSTWADISGATSTSYTTNSVDISANGYKFRCKVGVPCDGSSTNSPAATLNVSTCTTVGISSNPGNVTVSTGAAATFTVTATGSQPTYQWQISTDNGASFNNVTVGSGATTASYTTNTVNLANGNKFRCVVSVACDSSSSNSTAATLTVLDPTTFQFRSATSGNWTNTATWEQSLDNGGTWTATATIPSSTHSNITVQAGHTVTVSSAVTADDLTVAATGKIDLSGGVLTINNGSPATDATVNGTVTVTSTTGSGFITTGAGITFGTTGKFVHDSNSTAPNFPLATWSDGSLCVVSNSGPTGANYAVTNFNNQNFYDFSWDTAASSQQRRAFLNLSNTTIIRHDMYLNLPGLSNASLAFSSNSQSAVLIVSNDFTFNIPSNNLSVKVILAGASTDKLNIFFGGNVSVNGTWDANSGSVISFNYNGSGVKTFTPGPFIAYANTTRMNHTVAAGSVLKIAKTFTFNSGSTAGASVGYMTADGVLDLNGQSGQTAPNFQGASTGVITNSASGSNVTFSVGGGTSDVSSNTVFSGVISEGASTIALSKSGTNVLTLAGTLPNTYSGGTTLSGAGNGLIANKDGALGTGNVSVGSGTGAAITRLTLTNGTLNNYIGSNARLTINATNGLVDLGFTGTDDIGALSLDGGATFQAPGTFGATGSGATTIDNTHFAGTGVLNVLSSKAVVVTNPGNSTNCSGTTASFSASANGYGAATPSIQWQVSTNGGTSFSNIVGETSSSLNVTAAIDGAQYRAAFSNFVGTTTTTAGILSVSAISANTANYTETKGQTFKFTVASLLANASGSGGVGLSSVTSPSVNGVSLVISNGYVYYNGALASNDSFNYTVTNVASGCSATAGVTITASTNVFGQTTPSITTTGGNPNLTFYGIPGNSYTIQVSTDLFSWTDVTTITAGGSGVITYTDTTPPTPAAYYRLRYNP